MKRREFLGLAGATAGTLALDSHAALAAVRSAAPSAAPVTLHMAASPQPQTDAVKKLLPQFKRDTGISVTIDVMDENAMFQKIITENAAGVHSYDIIPQRDVDMLPYIQAGVIQSLNRWMTAAYKASISGFPQNYLDAQCLRYGKYYGILFGSGTTLFAYRKDLFARAGVAVPRTMDELLAAAKALTRNGTYGIVFRGQVGHHAATAWYLAALYPFGGQFMDYATKTPTLNTPLNVESLRFLAELAKYAPPDLTSFTYEDALKEFETGHAAMLIEVTPFIPLILNPSISSVAAQTAVGAMPHRPGAHLPNPIIGWTVGMSGHTAHPREVEMFIEYFTGPQHARQIALAGGATERTSVLTDPALIKQNPWFPAFLAEVKDGRFGQPLMTKSNQFNDIVGTYINQVLSGSMPAKEALDLAQAAIVNLLKAPGTYVYNPTKIP